MKTIMVLAALALGMSPQDGGLVVHEWGTFTSVAESDGVGLDWRPLLGPDDLPKFVYGTSGLRGAPRQLLLTKESSSALVRMETPVIYFYGKRETEVALKVMFPAGRITEWYPAAREIKGGLDWGRFTVRPEARVSLPKEAAPSHYYPARETDAAPVRVGQEHEKFLFYRGLGSFALPVRVTLEGQKVVVRNAAADPIAKLFVFENVAGKAGYRVFEGLKGEARLDRPTLASGAEEVMRDLEETLVAQGLFEREAKAMVKTWQDTWFEEGLRVFYVVPRRLTDAVLPLTVDPKPAELVRVLVARAEVITPEMERSAAASVRKLADPGRRAEAAKEIARFGRFSEPVLRRVAATAADPAVKARVAEYLARK